MARYPVLLQTGRLPQYSFGAEHFPVVLPRSPLWKVPGRFHAPREARQRPCQRSRGEHVRSPHALPDGLVLVSFLRTLSPTPAALQRLTVATPLTHRLRCRLGSLCASVGVARRSSLSPSSLPLRQRRRTRRRAAGPAAARRDLSPRYARSEMLCNDLSLVPLKADTRLTASKRARGHPKRPLTAGIPSGRLSQGEADDEAAAVAQARTDPRGAVIWR